MSSTAPAQPVILTLLFTPNFILKVALTLTLTATHIQTTKKLANIKFPSLEECKEEQFLCLDENE